MCAYRLRICDDTFAIVENQSVDVIKVNLVDELACKLSAVLRF